MGIAIADEFSKLGADVTLILGPSNQQPKEKTLPSSMLKVQTKCLLLAKMFF